MKKITHKERVENVRDFFSKNRLFTAIVIAVSIFIFNGVIGSSSEIPDKADTSEYVQEENSDNNETHWRFYWIDLWILATGGGVCSVMIIRERRKAKEGL